MRRTAGREAAWGGREVWGPAFLPPLAFGDLGDPDVGLESWRLKGPWKIIGPNLWGGKKEPR